MTRAFPAPNPDREKRMRRWLKQIDECLDIRWFNHVVEVQEGKQEGRYALITYLPGNDPLRQLESFEILGWFCVNMSKAATRPLPPDEMEWVVRGFLADCDGTRDKLKTRLQRVREQNNQLQERRKADAVDEAVEHWRDLRRSTLGIPFVPVKENIRS